jgi:hypothetical protein
MPASGTVRANVLRTTKLLIRFGLPLLGLIVFGDAVLRSVGGDIEHWRFLLGVLLILAGFAAQLVPRP